jgi:hypothetical protein
MDFEAFRSAGLQAWAHSSVYRGFMMNLAIFADLHGRIFLALKIVERYQRETGQTIDVIFEWEETDRGGRLKDDCLGILHWQDATEHQFHVVDAPWLKEYTPHTWQYL